LRRRGRMAGQPVLKKLNHRLLRFVGLSERLADWRIKMGLHEP
jgi:hypothetical protein